MSKAFFARADSAEKRLCVLANGACRRTAVRGFFRAVSRLGDGVFWYALIALMPFVVGLSNLRAGLAASLHMVLAGAFGLFVYKMLKNNLIRERPFVGSLGVTCAAPPLDRYSFPSGHTFHAVLFTTVALGYAPELLIVLAPFTILVAVSRGVLGLHYPSDVLAGALLGWGVAKLSWLPPLPPPAVV
jgi:undecaprenyl-diphosphatase